MTALRVRCECGETMILSMNDVRKGVRSHWATMTHRTYRDSLRCGPECARGIGHAGPCRPRSRVINACGAPMPQAGTTCARRKGHGNSHRSSWAMEHQARTEALERVLLGPVPCIECRVPLSWNGRSWRDESGAPHAGVHRITA